MEFTKDDLRLIMAMCRTSNPQYPDKPMYPSWIPVFEKAERQLWTLENPNTCFKCKGSLDSHFGYCHLDM
jgi:hypothetical protein